MSHGNVLSNGAAASRQLYTAITGCAGSLLHQLSVPNLVAESLRRGEGVLTDRGALRATTGKYTGRTGVVAGVKYTF